MPTDGFRFAWNTKYQDVVFGNPASLYSKLTNQKFISPFMMGKNLKEAMSLYGDLMIDLKDKFPEEKFESDIDVKDIRRLIAKMPKNTLESPNAFKIYAEDLTSAHTLWAGIYKKFGFYLGKLEREEAQIEVPGRLVETIKLCLS